MSGYPLEQSARQFASHNYNRAGSYGARSRGHSCGDDRPTAGASSFGMLLAERGLPHDGGRNEDLLMWRGDTNRGREEPASMGNIHWDGRPRVGTFHSGGLPAKCGPPDDVHPAAGLPRPNVEEGFEHRPIRSGLIISQPMGNIANHKQAQNKAPSVKLENCTGNTCLETFLAKFQNMSKYYCWNEADRLFYLRAHLDGAAGQLLWSSSERDTFEDVVKLLRTRFGSENQAERFRAELQVRKRRKGESLQSLYQDVSRLMALAYPRMANEMCDIVGRDAFLAALDDRQLHVRILEKEPKTLDEALKIAIRLAAFDRVGLQPAADDWGRRSGRNTRSVKNRNSSNGCSAESPVTKTEVEKLRDAVNQLQIENQSLREAASQSTTAKQFQNNETVNSSSQRGNYRGDRHGRSGDTCRKCGERGHWARDCDFESSTTSRPRVVVVGTKRRPAEVYLKIRISLDVKGAHF